MSCVLEQPSTMAKPAIHRRRRCWAASSSSWKPKVVPLLLQKPRPSKKCRVSCLQKQTLSTTVQLDIEGSTNSALLPKFLLGSRRYQSRPSLSPISPNRLQTVYAADPPDRIFTCSGGTEAHRITQPTLTTTSPTTFAEERRRRDKRLQPWIWSVNLPLLPPHYIK